MMKVKGWDQMKKLSLHALMLAGTCTAFAAPIAARAESGIGLSDHNVVRDIRGNVVKNTYNNCVRTRWLEGKDICGTPVAPRQVAQQRAYAPAPAPAPILAAVQQSRAFLVFFDFDKSKLTKDALGIIRSAQNDAAKQNSRAVYDIIGHSDRSGPDAYNMRLSERRARSVSAELQHLGVPSKDIRVNFRGEREPLVQTQDGVKEPQKIGRASCRERV